MIVYVIKRRWFEKHDHAEAYRKSLGLPPRANVKVSVSIRSDLCALLNALCEPPAGEQGRVPPVAGRELDATVPPEVIDEAYIATDIEVPDYVPRFLLDELGRKHWDERHAR